MPKRKFYLDTVTIFVEKDPKKVKGERHPGLAETIITDTDLNSLKAKLEAMWERENIPEAQRMPFRDLIDTIEEEKAVSAIIKELEDLDKNKAQVQIALSAVAAREESLKSLKEMHDYLKSYADWDKAKDIQLEITELLHTHRLLTVNAIEGILNWRDQLSKNFNVPPKNFAFMWEGQNYLIKLRNDLDFLKDSEYTKIFNFGGEEPDPLLVCPSNLITKPPKNNQILVPISANMNQRVKDAEDAVRDEWDWTKHVEENDPRKIAENVAPEICDEYVDEVIEEFLKELGDEVQEEKDAAARKLEIDKENDNIAEKIYNDLFDGLIGDIEKIAQDEYAAELAIKDNLDKEKKNEDDKLARLIYKSLKDELMDTFLGIIAKEAVEEGKKEVAEEKSVYERGNIIEEMGLDFANAEAFNDLNGVMWIPIGLSEEYIEEALEEYYRFIPGANKEAVPDIETLMSEVTKNMDTRWYWAIRNKVIFALLIFSLDCFTKTGRKVIVHHISSLYWRALPAIIESATEHIWKVDTCDEARISLFAVMNKELTPEIKKMMNATKYKWKAEYHLKKFDVTVFGRQRPNSDEKPAVIPFQLKVSCFLHANDNSVNFNTNMCDEIGHIGNRQIFLNSLLGLIGRLEKSELKISMNTGTTLQKEISNILNLMNQTQSFSFPNMKTCVTSDSQEAQKFCESIGIHETPILGSRISISYLDIGFRWISCTNVIENIRGENVKYMRFKSDDVICMKIEDTEVIKVPTELPNITAFFIQNNTLKRELNEALEKKLDLFCLTEQLLMKGQKIDAHEVWVPCFNKAAKYDLPWIEGYELLLQTEEQKTSYISKCTEDTKLNIDQSIIQEGLLTFSKKKGPVLMHDFIFGLMYTKGDKILDIPLFCCLVQNKDWVKVR